MKTYLRLLVTFSIVPRFDNIFEFIMKFNQRIASYFEYLFERHMKCVYLWFTQTLRHYSSGSPRLSPNANEAINNAFQ